jgi:hypothetical protein
MVAPEREALSSEQRELLLAVYQLERHEEQAANSAHGALLAGTLTTLAAISVVLLRKGAPGWMDAVLPLAPLPLLALVTGLLRRGGHRAAYIDACEERLEEKFDGLAVPSQHREAHKEWRHTALGQFNIALIVGVLTALYVGVVIQSYRAATHAHEHTFGLVILIVCSCLFGACLMQIALGLRYKSTARPPR